MIMIILCASLAFIMGCIVGHMVGKEPCYELPPPDDFDDDEEDEA